MAWPETVRLEIAVMFRQPLMWDAVIERLYGIRSKDLLRQREHHRAVRGSFPPVRCAECRHRFTGRKGARFCSNRCKQRDKYRRCGEALRAAQRVRDARRKR